MVGLVPGQNRGYQIIVRFEQVEDGEQFASSVTGQVFRKASGVSNYNGDHKWEWFEPNALVYVGGNLNDGCLY